MYVLNYNLNLHASGYRWRHCEVLPKKKVTGFVHIFDGHINMIASCYRSEFPFGTMGCAWMEIGAAATGGVYLRAICIWIVENTLPLNFLIDATIKPVPFN